MCSFQRSPQWGNGKLPVNSVCHFPDDILCHAPWSLAEVLRVDANYCCGAANLAPLRTRRRNCTLTRTRHQLTALSWERNSEFPPPVRPRGISRRISACARSPIQSETALGIPLLSVVASASTSPASRYSAQRRWATTASAQTPESTSQSPAALAGNRVTERSTSIHPRFSPKRTPRLTRPVLDEGFNSRAQVGNRLGNS